MAKTLAYHDDPAEKAMLLTGIRAHRERLGTQPAHPAPAGVLMTLRQIFLALFLAGLLWAAIIGVLMQAVSQ